MKSLKEYLVPTVTLFIICLVAAALLGITNDVTSPIISDLAAENEINTRKEVFPDAVSFGEAKNAGEASVVAALDKNNNIIGYVVVNVGKGGYGGDISVMTGVTADGKVTGISILSHNETPGLGAKAKTDDGWSGQFEGLTKGITVSKDGSGTNSIKAITGATKTSSAVTNAVNEAIEIALAGGESNG